MSNRIRILSTSDVHGKIFPHSYADGSSQNIGFAKISKVIEKLRDENTILIDNGDTLEGSPLQLFYMLERREGPKAPPVSRVMKELKYDYINLGNHDFNFGVDMLYKHIKGTGAKCITRNLSHLGRGIDSLAEDREYELLEVAGKKLAIFGIITHFVPKWEGEDKVAGLEFRDAFCEARKIVNQIKEDGLSDYIICVYHGGFEYDPETKEPIGLDNGENQGYRIINEIPEIDVFITGHQHLVFQGVGGASGKTAYTQPGQGGQYVSCIDIDVEKGEIIPKLFPIGDDFDEGILDIVREEERDCQDWLDQVIGHTNLDLRIHDEYDSRLNKSQLITYLNQKQMEYSGADLSSVALAYGATGIGPDITMRQIVSTYVFPNTLVSKRINGRILKDYLEKNMEFWLVEKGEIIVNPEYEAPILKHFNYDMLDGVEYIAQISNPLGERIISLTRGGKPVSEEDEFTIVLNNYRAAGGGEFFMLSDAEQVWDDPMSMVDILAEAIRGEGVIDFEPVNNIEIIV